tara:strand:+ start:475 stop:996 length:522 start_codon:yes stop_codon:yes gene_type:complete
MFAFKTQNEVGQRGERLFLEHYPEWSANNVAENCKEPDFKDKHGRTLEVKFDVSARASRDKKGFQLNFFMETVSNDQRQTPGGVYRAKEEGVTFFVYMFEEPFRLFAMDVGKTEKRVRELIETGWYRKCRIKNRHYYTEGYPLPIAEFADCMVDLRAYKCQEEEKACRKELMK